MTLRRIVLIAAAVLVALAVPASANHTYTGQATATALKLTVTPPGAEEQGLTIGFTEAKVQSAAVEGGCEGDARVCAAAAAALEPFGTTVQTRAPGDPGPKSSTAFALPAPLNQILGVQVAPATAESQLEPVEKGTAAAGVSTVEVTLTETLGQQVPQIEQGLKQVNDTLSPILTQDPTGQVGPRVKGVLDALIENLGAAPLARITAGPTSSTASDADGVTTAVAQSNGGIITLVPTPESLPTAPDGLAIIEVGAARATATTDQLKGTASFDPAVVRVRVFDPTVEGGYREVEVATNQPKTCVGQAPVVACIGAGSGMTEETGAAAAAEAQGVTVELFEAPLPKVTLQLATAAAGVNAAPPPPPPPPVQPADDLPRTGGGGPGLTLPALALGSIGLVGLATVRRRRA